MTDRLGEALAPTDEHCSDFPEDEEFGEPIPHGEFCTHAPHTETRTKGEWREMIEETVSRAFWAFDVMRGGDGNEWTTEERSHIAAAMDEAGEAMDCYTGVGSCGRGWCKHS